jgi:hypothetical protein
MALLKHWTLKMSKNIKVLECPKWIKVEHRNRKSTLENDFIEIEPFFYREGRYLLKSNDVVIEYDGRAWISKNHKESLKQFHKDLNYSQYKGVNILSREQSKAIEVLLRINLASEKQKEIYSVDASRKGAKIYRMNLIKRMKANVHWNPSWARMDEDSISEAAKITTDRLTHPKSSKGGYL